jgi:hypothetical protein
MPLPASQSRVGSIANANATRADQELRRDRKIANRPGDLSGRFYIGAPIAMVAHFGATLCRFLALYRYDVVHA